MKLGYVIIYVPDVSIAADFYEAAFGLRRRFVHESGYAEMETGGTALAFATEALAGSNGIAFRTNRAGDALAAGVEIALVCDDVASAFARALEVGASEVRPPAEKPWGQTVAYVRDLNGILVELCSPVHTG